MTTMTRGQEVATDVSALLRARNSLIWVVTREEARVERLLIEAAVAAGYLPHMWDCAQGFTNIKGQVDIADKNDPGDAFNAIRQRAMVGERELPNRGVWIMRDLPVWLSGPPNAPTLRQLRNLARLLSGVPRKSAQAIIVLTPSSDIPPELAGHATVVEWPLPDRGEIAALLDGAIEGLPEFELDPETGKPDESKPLRSQAAANGTRDAAIDAAIGLSGDEAASCFARSLVQSKKIEPLLISKEKKRVIARERVLEWFDPIPGGLDAVGGLGNLKPWLMERAMAYSPKAREYGLPPPKGAMLVGVQGCGKTLTAKAVSTAWRVPLLRVDLGALKSKFVGESEANLRKAFNVIGTIGRCVVWIDEIEKALQGATSGAADGGVSADALGAILTWMQERQGEAFVIATANDVSALPPELLRKGRFDEVWFIDLPTYKERVDILAAALRTHNRSLPTNDLKKIAAVCRDFTGSELASLVPDALFKAFSDGARPLVAEDLLKAAATVVPLSKTFAEKIASLRKWAAERARPASLPEEEGSTVAAPDSRALDI